MAYSLYIDGWYIGIFDTIREVMYYLKNLGWSRDFDIYEVV